MSSGSKTRKRQQIVKVRCTVDEAAQLAALAKAQGKTVNSCVRDALIIGARPAPRPRRRQPAADEREFTRIVSQLGSGAPTLTS